MADSVIIKLNVDDAEALCLLVNANIIKLKENLAAGKVQPVADGEDLLKQYQRIRAVIFAKI
jgi:hypothetical protein